MTAIDYHAVADVIVAAARRNLGMERAKESARPLGERRVDFDFWSPADRGVDPDRARWCVVIVKWAGPERRWRRLRRISGPLTMVDALRRCEEESARRNLPRVGL